MHLHVLRCSKLSALQAGRKPVDVASKDIRDGFIICYHIRYECGIPPMINRNK